jgi:Na+-translocating ferredoxin:NAD+ oxidoreductase RnfE subunit
MIALFREILGTGGLSVFGFKLFSIPVLSEHPMTFFISPPGAFLVIGLLMALFRWIGVIKSE